MSTLRDQITSSAKLVGVLGQGESLSASEAQDALRAFNGFIDSSSNDNLLIFSNVYESFPLVSGQQSYTMGPSANFNTVRPQRINNCVLTVNNGASSFDLPLDILNQDQWANITVKQTQSPIPTKMFPQGTFPNETLWFWPVPSVANTINFWSWKPYTDPASLDTTISFPPGYQEFFDYNFGIRLSAMFQKKISNEVAAIAISSKSAIKRMNSKIQLLACDQALMPTPAIFNYLTGE